MKRLIAQWGLALALLAGAPCALAQESPPPLPALTPAQATDVEQRVDAYRQETDARVSRGEISREEADRLVAWRHWQLARQAAARGPAPMGYDAVPPDYYDSRQRDYAVIAPPPPYYGPSYPPPYYWGPRPYYWGPAICAGGFGRHFGGRICF